MAQWEDAIVNITSIYKSVGHSQFMQDMARAQASLKQFKAQSTAVAFTQEDSIKRAVQLDKTIGQAFSPDTKNLGTAVHRLGLLNKQMREGTRVGYSNAAAYNNLIDGSGRYYQGTMKSLSATDRMRVSMTAFGRQISAVSLHMQSMGKNMQWTGRQMMVGLTLPMAAGAGLAIKQWQSVNKEIIRVQKVSDNFKANWADPNAVNKTASAQENLLKSARKLGHEYAAVDEIVLAAMGDFAAMGYNTKPLLKNITELTLRTSALGEVDIADATKAVRTIMAVYGQSISEASDTLAIFNKIENETAINQKDLIQALPEVANSAEQFGLSAADTATMLAAMYAQGIPATEAAHALKFALTSLVKPTRATADQLKLFAQYEPELAGVFQRVIDGTLSGKEAMNEMGKAYMQMEQVFGESKASEFLSNLVGKRQANRIRGLFKEINNAEGPAQLDNDYKKATDATEDLTAANKALNKEWKALKESDAFRLDQAKADFKAWLADIGKTLMPRVLSGFEALNKFAKKIIKVLKDNPALQKLILGFAALLAAIGPVVFITGQLITAGTTLTHGFGMLIPKLKKIDTAAMSMAQAMRIANGEAIIAGDSAFETKTKFGSFISKVGSGIKKLLGIQPANTAVSASNGGLTASTDTLTAAIKAQTTALAENSTAKMLNAATEWETPADAFDPFKRVRTSGLGSEVADDVAEQLSLLGPNGGARNFAPTRFGNLDVPAGKMYGNMQVTSGPLGDIRTHVPIVDAVQPNLWPNGVDSIRVNDRIKLPAQSPNISRNLPDFDISDFIPASEMDDVLEDAFKVRKNGGLIPKMLGLTEKWQAKGGWAEKIFAPLNKGLNGILNKIPAGGMMAGLLGDAAGTGGGALAGVASAAAPALGIGAAVAAVVAAIIGLIALIAVLSGHWKQFWAGVKAGVKPAVGILKSAFESIKRAGKALLDGLKAMVQPVIDLFNDIAETIGGSKNKKKSQNAGWAQLGLIIGGIGTALSVLVKGLAVAVEWLAKLIALAMKGAIWLLKLTVMFNMIKIGIKWAVIAISDFIKIFTDSKNAWKHAANFFFSLFVNPVKDMINFLIKMVGKLISIFLWQFEKLGGILSGIPIIGGAFDSITEKIKKARAALEDPYQIPDIRIDVETNAIQIDKKKAGDDGADAGDEAKDKAQEKLNKDKVKMPIEVDNNYLSTLKSKIDDEMQKIRQKALDNFDAMAKARIKTIDDQIKSIEDQEKAEQELFETQEYLNNRRKMLDEFNTLSENYKRDRALAIYEGRYQDARMLDLQYRSDSKTHNESLQNLDDERNKALLQKERDAQKERLEAQKEGLQAQLDLQRAALEEQLNEIIKWTPRNVAAMADMIDQMNSLLEGAGAETMGSAMENATAHWGVAVAETAKQIEDDAYWAGKSITDAAAAGMKEEDVPPSDTVEKAKKWRSKASKVASKALNKAQKAISGSKGKIVAPESPGTPPSASYPPDTRMKYHTGGFVGSGSPRDVPAVLQTGEYVIQRNAVKKLGVNYLNKINRYHEGGTVIGDGFSDAMYSMLGGQILSFFSGEGTFGGFSKQQIMSRYAPRGASSTGTGIGALSGIFVSSLGGYMVDWLQNLLIQAFPDMEPNIALGSKLRPMDIGSFHATGQALDIGSMPGNRLDRLVDIFDYLSANKERFDLVELIHKNQIWHPWDDWQKYSAMDHYDHVHVAVGSWKEGMIPLAKGGKVMVDNLPSLLHKGEVVIPSRVVDKLEKGGTGGDTYIMVENFIGQREWFEKMMGEYKVKSLPADQRKRGTINRVVSSRKDNTVRYT